MNVHDLRSEIIQPTRGERLRAWWQAAKWQIYTGLVYGGSAMAIWLSGAIFGYVLRMAGER